MPLTPEQYAALPAIYDAAASPRAWRKALDATAAIADATGATLLAIDTNGLPFQAQYVNSAYDALDVEEYFSRIAQYEEAAWKTLVRSPSQRLVMDDVTWPDLGKIADREDMLWYRKKRIFRRAGAKLNSDSGWDDCLGLQYPDSMLSVPEPIVRRTEELLPHLAKVVQLHRTFSILQSRFNAALQALDHVRIGVFVVTPSAGAILRNREASRLLDQVDGLSLSRHKQLCCHDSDATRVLHAAISTVSRTCNGEADSPERLISAKRLSGAEPYLLEIAPLSDAEGELEQSMRGAIVFAIDPDNLLTVNVTKIAKFFDLTASEAIVCDHIVHGKVATEIADLRNVSVDTVKSQIKSVHVKLNVGRRADLIRKILTVMPPIDDPTA